ncbi:hypothetical protein MMC24_002352 [Lignoscripta atroalba]|nr:hypothetical protein [Lignoscripta atroalba]
MRLPAEIRAIVYRLALVSDQVMEEQSAQMEEYRNDNKKLTGDIDSSILVTCKLMYDGAPPLLYRQNRISFIRPYGMPRFNGIRQALESGRTLRLERVWIEIATKPYGDRPESIGEDAKLWISNSFGPHCGILPSNQSRPSSPSQASMLLKTIKHLEYDFAQWQLTREDRFSPSLLKGINGSGWKLDTVETLALGNHEVVTEILEQAHLKKPPARGLTDSNDVRLTS